MPVVGFAQSLPEAASPAGTGAEPIIAILETVGNWMFGILLAVAAIYILIAAFTFLMAKGDPKKIDEAKSSLTYALIAVVVGALTKGIIAVAQAIAQGSGI